MNEKNIFFEFNVKMQEAFPAMYNNADAFETIGISLCLAPVIQPDLLDNFIKTQFGVEGDFPLIGGIRGTQHRGIMPSGETWLYFCCENDTKKRINFIQLIPTYLSNSNSLLNVEPSNHGEPFLSGKLVFSNNFRKNFQKESIIYEQRFSDLKLGGFINTSLSLSDLVLNDQIENCVEEIKHWQHFIEKTDETSKKKMSNKASKAKENNFLKRIKPGLKILFYGKSGTGKTQTAAIIANELEKKIYRIDLSQIGSKYIGETEKNLAKIFEAAEAKGWILFFDEGDALFGKRTSVSSSNDRYANQEVAYLLQRIEDFAGIIIISTNFKENIDTAFLRRFQIITEFPMPEAQQRRQIWEKLLAELTDYQVNIKENEWDEISKIELSGGAITNIVNFVLVKANFTKDPITFTMVKQGIVRELRKENRLTSL